MKNKLPLSFISIEDLSFVNYTCDKKLGILSMVSNFNFIKDEMDFKIPVYFIQGNNDIQTSAVINKKYFK